MRDRRNRLLGPTASRPTRRGTVPVRGDESSDVLGGPWSLFPTAIFLLRDIEVTFDHHWHPTVLSVSRASVDQDNALAVVVADKLDVVVGQTWANEFIDRMT